MTEKKRRYVVIEVAQGIQRPQHLVISMLGITDDSNAVERIIQRGRPQGTEAIVDGYMCRIGRICLVGKDD